MPTLLNWYVKVKPVLCWPEFHNSPPTAPGMQLLESQVPEVEECSPCTQSHSTIVPTGIVVVELPLEESTKLVLPLGPTCTMWFVFGVGDLVGVRVLVDVRVLVGVRVNVGVDEPVSVGVTDLVRVTDGVTVAVGVFEGVGGIDPVRVGVGVRVAVLVAVGVTGGIVGVGTGGFSGANVRRRKTAIWPRVTDASGQ